MKKVLAFLFQRDGEKISKDDFIYTQSADLDWYSSDYARRVLERALELGLIEVEDDSVTAGFNFESIDIPMGFEPPKDLLEKEEEKDVFQELLGQVSKKSELSRQEIMSLVNDKQDEMNIEVRTALLVVAQERKIDIDDRDEYIDLISKDIRGVD
ncbi:MAG: DUF2240 family protein [Candidatus Thermoplasmatota archaeon]